MSQDFNQALHAVIGAHQRGEIEVAEQGYRALLKQQPQHPDLLHLLGVIAYQQQRLDEAQQLIEQAIALHPNEAQFHSNLGNVLYDKQRYGDAVNAYVRAVGLDQKRNVTNPVVLCNLGNSLLSLERHTEAKAVLEQAYAMTPDDPAVMVGYALMLKEHKRYTEAIELFERLLAAEPASLLLRTNLGNTLSDAGRYAEAQEQYALVLQRQPDHLEVRYGCGLALWRSGQTAAGLLQFQACLELNEQYSQAHHAMIAVLETAADHTVVLQEFEAALRSNPRAEQLHSVLAYSSDFNPGMSAADQQQVRKDWYAQQIVPRAISALPLQPDRNPERKLRIGFIPGRFYRNASIYAYLPVLLRLDPAQFEIWCYDGFFVADEFTVEIQKQATSWCDISRMSNVETAERIRADKIDILVDLFAHAGANRLPIYAYKPAPIQVTAWGHANGTGMAEMDYLFSDPVSIPPQEVDFYAEHVHYLPCQLSYWLPENAPPVAPLPMLKNGFVTFGCFNRMIKVSDAILDIWAQLLARLPGSRLVLKSVELADLAQQQRVLTIFERHGVLPGRLSFHLASSWYEHLERYADVDFALDPFPMGGGVTTLDALWMGVPVLCLRGKTLGQRITSAIMTAISLDDWVTESVDDYLQRAVIKAGDMDALQRTRTTLRRRMAASPLANADYYVGCVADAFRAFWRQWCADPTQRLPQPAVARFDVAEHSKEADLLWRDFQANPDSPEVLARLAESMQRSGKNILAKEFLAQQ